MLNPKRFMLIAAIFVFLPVLVTAQTRPGLTPGVPEMTVEQSYLQESIELMIIREQARAEGRDMKMVALQFIGDAIERGNRSDEIRATLEFLALEGVLNVARENGRVVNNFPDVRRQAANYLGVIGTPEAAETLMKIVSVDNEPMVLQEAVRSLGLIGINNNDETVNTIAWTVNRFNNLNPDNLLALAAIEAFERLSAANNGQLNHNGVQTLIRIAEGRYIRPVQDRARLALSELRGFN